MQGLINNIISHTFFFHRNKFSLENSDLEKGISDTLFPPFSPFFPLSAPFSATVFSQKKNLDKNFFFAQIKILFEKKIVKMTRRLVVVPELNGRSVSVCVRTLIKYMCRKTCSDIPNHSIYSTIVLQILVLLN